MDGLMIVLLVCGAGGAIAFAAVTALSPEQSVARLRLQELAGGGAAAQAGKRAEATEPRARKKGEGLLGRMAQRLGNSARSFLEGGSDDTVHRLAMAGYSSPHHAASFHGMRMMIALGAAAVAALGTFFSGAPVGKMILYAAGSLVAGLIIPNIGLSRVVKRRQEKISAALPNMVDLLVVCVEAGLALDGAMARVGQELQLSAPDLSRELTSLSRELSAGQAHEHALGRMAWRIGLPDVDNLVSMLIQAERFGTSIAVSLRVFSDSFRTARRQRIEEKAAKTTVKLLIPLIFFIFPAVFVILLGPAVVNLIAGGVLK
ncbi:MAG: type II secretion system F family protein [Candidatus Tectomicrobia bacterium]|nr:type II secretion system F family protein [Candidatus Tectomicrobia bacterium]